MLEESPPRTSTSLPVQLCSNNDLNEKGGGIGSEATNRFENPRNTKRISYDTVEYKIAEIHSRIRYLMSFQVLFVLFWSQ